MFWQTIEWRVNCHKTFLVFFIHLIVASNASWHGGIINVVQVSYKIRGEDVLNASLKLEAEGKEGETPPQLPDDAGVS